MSTSRLFIVASAALVGGCMLFFPPIRSGLTASVEGLVGQDDIHEIAGDHFANRSIWGKYGSQQAQMLHVRLSTSRDIVSFSDRKHLQITVRWHFCDDPRQQVHLGQSRAFVNGREVWGLYKPSPTRDGTGHFVYDVILHARHGRSEEDRRSWASGVVEETFDLEREPRDVCVAVWLITKPGGYRTKAARIPKEDIAAALGVELPSASATEVGTTTP